MSYKLKMGSKQDVKSSTSLMDHIRLQRISQDAKEALEDLKEMAMSFAKNSNNRIYDLIPDTPNYSKSSTNVSMILPEKIPPQEDIYHVLILTLIVFFIQAFSTDVWIWLLEPVLPAFPTWSKVPPEMIHLWNIAVSGLLTIPACIFINKYGIKTSLLFSCAIGILGTGLWFFTSITDSTIFFQLVSVISSCSSIATKPLMATISARCFKIGERNRSTGYLTAISMTGTGAGALMPIVLRKLQFNPTKDPEVWKGLIARLMITCFILNVICLLLIHILLRVETEAKDIQRFDSLSSKTSSCALLLPLLLTDKPTVFAVLKNVNFWYVSISYACMNAFSWPWFLMLPNTFSYMKMSETIAEHCQLWAMVSASIFTCNVGLVADKIFASKRNPYIVMTLQLLSMGSLGLITMVMKTFNIERKHALDLATFAMIIALPMSWSTRCLMYELAADTAYPSTENVAVGFAELIRTIFETTVYLFLTTSSVFRFWFDILMIVVGLLGAAFLLPYKP